MTVLVEDANDNYPVFAQTHYSARLQENMEVDTSVLQMKAYDLDEGPNGEIT